MTSGSVDEGNGPLIETVGMLVHEAEKAAIIPIIMHPFIYICI